MIFRNAARELLAHDLWAVPDGLERLTMVHGARRDVLTLGERRRATMALGPRPLPDGAPRGRFVFVVCGPITHIDTLLTAIRNLRPVTASEIWLLTDPARNARPLSDIPGVDHVVEVATPAEFDDHQASIWLKTSVHRHLPEGEWCYLDSDIIAVDPGVDAIFGCRGGPLTFASDLTIASNAVDRFSPWAMNCACSGVGEDHSCGHLREQLQARMGLDVPGDWVHWNGGVFLFGPDSAKVLDTWHEWAVESFGWPQWRTRDQGTLIATVWKHGLQDTPRLPSEFNFIADLGNTDVCLDLERGWALHPGGPWVHPRLLHLYTSALDDPQWDLSRDVELVILRRSKLRVYRWRRGELRSQASEQARVARHRVHTGAIELRWKVQHWVEWRWSQLARQPQRLAPARVISSIRRRLTGQPEDPPAAEHGPSHG